MVTDTLEMSAQLYDLFKSRKMNYKITNNSQGIAYDAYLARSHEKYSRKQAIQRASPKNLAKFFDPDFFNKPEGEDNK